MKYNKDKRILVPILKATKNLYKTLNVIYDYPHVIPDIIKYQIPEINTEIPAGFIRINILSIDNFPKTKDLFLVFSIPCNKSGVKLVTSKFNGPKANLNISYDAKIDSVDKQIVLLMKTQKASCFLISGDKQLGEVQFYISSIYKSKDALLNLSFEAFPSSIISFRIQVRRSLSGIESKIVEKPLLVSPLILFESTVQKPPPPKPQTENNIHQQNNISKDVSKDISKDISKDVSNDEKVNPSEQAKLKLRKQTNLPTMVTLTEQQLNQFWSHSLLEFLKNGSSLVIKAHSIAKIPPPNDILLMNRICTSKIQSLELDFENNKITQDDYINLIRKAIDRENSIINNYSEGKERDEAKGRIGIMSKELSEMIE